ncbi:MAG: caspase family protein [Kiritimatiellae bacterium]|nr:caspase family protein [Kiritimatiellia bacterium]
MKKRTMFLPVVLALVIAVMCGCSTVNSGVYTKGAIQQGRHVAAASDQPDGSGGQGAVFGTVKVNRFTESRDRRAVERHNLWLACIPLACVGTYWERPDWMLWSSDQAGYKPAGIDMAEALQSELAGSGLFRNVLGPNDTGSADWEIDGDIEMLSLMLRPHLCGLSVIMAPYVGAVGIPLGTWTFDQRVKVRLRYGGVEGASEDIFGKVFATQAEGMMAAYYGGNPMQFGYPYDSLMRPMVSTILAELPPTLARAELSRPDKTVVKTEPAVAKKAAAVAVSSPTPAVPAAAAISKRGIHWAVIIGVSAYRDTRIAPLRYATHDAQKFYDWIISPQGGRHSPANVKLLLDADATAVNIRQALFGWLQQAVAEDQVTIYFAGHGSPDAPGSSSNLFLLPCDTDYGNISSTAFPMWDVETALKRYVRARRVVVIADACHSAGVGEGFDIARRSGRGLAVNPIGAGFEQLANVGEGACVICASGGAQTSQEGEQWGGGHGVFTYFLLNGLRGDADFLKDGHITLGELTQYVSEQVRRATKNTQTPIISGRYDPSWVLSSP